MMGVRAKRSSPILLKSDKRLCDIPANYAIFAKSGSLVPQQANKDRPPYAAQIRLLKHAQIRPLKQIGRQSLACNSGFVPPRKVGDRFSGADSKSTSTKKGQTFRSDLEEAATYSPTGKPQYHRRK